MLGFILGSLCGVVGWEFFFCVSEGCAWEGVVFLELNVGLYSDVAVSDIC